MAFLDKLKAGLAKTKKAIFGQIDEVLKAFVKVDEDLLEELEELLIMADVGVGATEEIIERLREAIKDGKLVDLAPDCGAMGNGHARALEHFSRIVLDGAEKDYVPEQGVNMIKILDAIYESAKTGKPYYFD